MIENSRKYFKKGLMVVSIILMFFFLFTLNSYADENWGTDILPEAQEVLSKAKQLNESGDKASAKEIIIKFIKAKLETASDHMSTNDYISMFEGEDINEITEVNAELLDLIGGFDEAVKIYKEAYEARPDNLMIMGVYAGLLFKTKQYAEAAPLIEKVYDVSENNHPWQLLTAAHSYYLAKNPAEAKRIVNKMMELPGAPQNEWLASFYQICMANGDVDEASTYLESYNETARIKKINTNYLSQFPGDDQACPPDDGETDSTPRNLNEVDDPPRVAQTYIPVYPIKAMVEGIEGRVVLKFVVNRDGYATEPIVFNADPEGIFEESALDAVTEFRFIPARKDGKCVNCIVRLPVVFELGPKPPVPGGK